MPNTLLTPDMITRRALMVLENTLTAAKYIDRQYDDSFANSGAKIGATLRIRKPPQYVVQTALALAPQDTIEEFTTLIVNQQPHVGMTFTSAELALSIDDFSDRIIVPAIAQLANYIDQLVLGLWVDVYNVVGTPGTPPGSTGGFPDTAAKALFTYGSAKVKMDNEAAPPNDRSIIVNPVANVMLVSALSGLFHASTEVEQQYREGNMGLTMGYKFSMDQNVGVATIGALGGAPQVASTPASGATALATKGWTASVTGLLNVGDVFTIAGVFSVNPRSKLSTGQLRQFVVTAVANSDGAGNATVQVQPAMISTGGQQNITALPAVNANIVVYGAAGTVSPQNIACQRGAFTLASADLENPNNYGAWGARVSSKKLGISMTLARQYDINTTNIPARVDVLFGVKTIRPELACRIAG